VRSLASSPRSSSTLNLHIFLGPDDGYMSSPSQVQEHSLLLVAVDVVILIAGPVVAAILAVRSRRGDEG
jgi:hypothetical protein